MHPPVSTGKELCKTHASSFYLAAHSLPTPLRESAYNLYGFCRATDQILDGPGTHEEKESTLKEWEAELAQGWNHPSSNPIIRDFIATCRAIPIAPEWGFRFIHGLKKDLRPLQFKNFDELYAYCFSAAAIPGIMIASAAHAPPDAMNHAISLGIGMQLTNILRDIREDFEMGRVYLPANELNSFQYSLDDLREGKISDSFIEFMKFQIKRARTYYAHAETGINLLPKDAQAGLGGCLVFYREILAEIERAHYDVFSSRIHVSESRKQELLRNASARPISTILKT